MPPKAHRLAWMAAVTYSLVVAGWFLISNTLIQRLVPNAEARQAVSLLKDCGFGILTAVFLYVVLRRSARDFADFSALKQQALVEKAEDEARYRQLFEMATDAVILIDAATLQILEANPAAVTLFGYPAPDLLQLKVTDISAEPDQTVAAIAAGLAQIPLRRLRRRNGSLFAAEISCSRFVYQGRRVHMSTFRDITERQRAAEALQRSEFLLQEGQRLMKVGYWEWNLLTNVHTWSGEIFLIYGRDPALGPADVSEMPQYFTAESWSRLNAAVAQAVKIGTAYECDAELIRGDGTRGWVTARGKSFHDGSGSYIGLRGTVQDITERKLAETALVEGKEKFEAIFNNNALATIVIEPDAAISMVNDAYCQISGYSRPEVVGHSWKARIFPEDLDRLSEYYRRRLLEWPDAPREYEFRFLHKNGEVRHAQVAVSMIKSRRQIVASMLDITDRKRAEEDLNWQFSALSAVANGIMMTDRKGRIKWVNPAFCRLSGYDREEVLGRNPRFQKSGQQPDAFYAQLWATINTGNVWHGELVNQRKDGVLYTEDMTITPVRGADGEIAHFVAIKQDVTERRTLENRLRQAQKMEAIGTLAGGIAHDFNNILMAMFGYGHLLQGSIGGDAAAMADLGEILGAANRARDLVQQILTFSRQGEQKRLVISLAIVVKEATKFLRASLPSQIKIDLQIAEDAPAVLADATQIYQVTMNLATNALHAMEGQPGKLTVGLTAFVPTTEFIQSHPEMRPGEYARLTVADTGHGMDAKTLERIFDPFFTTKPVGKGTGLGLAVVHGIVQSHEGLLTVESEVGKGTTFNLYFPGQTSQAALPAAPSGPVANGHGQTILVLDDEPSLTSSLQRLLLHLNYQVITSNHPGEALRIFRENPAQFDLVITDLTMPEINGLKVARQIHALRAELPVILISGYTATLEEADINDAGIREILEKPTSSDLLAEAVHRALLHPLAVTMQ